MRLYLNNKEVDALKEALRNASSRDTVTRDRQITILERVILCEQLQGNIEKADIDAKFETR